MRLRPKQLIVRLTSTTLFCAYLISGAMLTAFAQRPELVSQTGHSDRVRSAAFSSDGRFLASASEDETVRLWDVGSGMELRVFSGHSGDVNSVVFSPDGRWLASGSSDKLVKIWDVQTGKELRTLKGHTALVNMVAFSPDGKTIASGSYDRSVRLWRAEDGGELFNIPACGSVNQIAFEPAGQLLAGACYSKISIWNRSTGKEVRSFTGGLHDVNSMSLSPDGKSLAAVVTEWKLREWNLETGQELRSNSNYPTNVRTVAFSTDGRLIVAAIDNEAIVFFNGKTLRRLDIPVSGPAADLIFSKDGTMLASAGIHGEITLLDGATGKVAHQLAPRSSGVTSVVFSPDGKVLASGNGDGTVKMWQLNDGSGARILSAYGPTGKIAFSSSGEIVAAATFPRGRPASDERFWDRLRVWDVASGKDLSPVPFFPYRLPVVSLAFSPKGSVLAVGGQVHDGIRLLDPIARKEVGSKITDAGSVSAVTFSPNGEKLASCFGNQIFIWDPKTGVKLQTFSGHSAEVYTLAFSPDGRTLASGAFDNLIKLWDVESGDEIKTLAGHTSVVGSVSFRPDGNELASGSWDSKIKIWDVKTATELRTLDGHANSVESVTFSPDGRILASGSSDGKIKLWSASGSELATLTGVDRNDWLVTTPDGFFDGTPNAWKRLIWRFNNNTFDHAPVEAYFNDFFYPNLLQDVLAGRSPKPKPGQELSKIDRRQPKVEIARINGLTKDAIAATPQLSSTVFRRSLVEIDITDNGGKKNDPSNPATSGAQDLRLFRNGSLVSVWHGDLFRSDGFCKPQPPLAAGGPRRVRCVAPVSLPPGENSFTAYAFNSSNIRSTDVPFSMKGRDSNERVGTLYVLAIGVNKYANPSLDLKFAVADVSEISQAIAKQQEKLADQMLTSYARTEVITLTDEQARKENILSALNRFRDADEQSIPAGTPSRLRVELEKIKRAEPEDAIMIYFAGHGLASGDRFYLLPHNFKEQTRQRLAEDAISDLELSSVLERVDAGKILMAIDACQSGQALGRANEGKGPMNSKGLAQLAYDKGMFILTAAQSQQAALEVSRLGHGLLTYSLLQGLEKADKNSGGEIIERKWLDYAVRTVPDLQLDEMRKRAAGIKQDPTKRDAEIVFINGDNKKLPPEKRGLQTPRVFYRRELESRPLVVARP